jgi:hypothetical protein
MEIFGGVAMLLAGQPAGMFYLSAGAVGLSGSSGSAGVSGMLSGMGAGTSFLAGVSGGAGGGGTGGAKGGGYDLSTLGGPNLVNAVGGGSRGNDNERRNIPSSLGVSVYFQPGANQPIDPMAVETLGDALAQTKLQHPEFESITVSATTNGVHAQRSLHYSKNGALAVDIAAVNRTPLSVGYGRNDMITEITKTLQINLRSPVTYENFGPFLLEKGQMGFRPTEALRLQHFNHIHFSVLP